MQRRLFYIFSAVCLAVLISASSAQAQSLQRYEGNIPFDFNVGSDTYKAGLYTIDVSSSAGSVVWNLVDSNHKIVQTMAIMKNGAVSRNDRSRLIFDKVDDSYILSKMATPFYGLKLPKTYVTISVSAKNSSSAKPKAETVAVLLK